MIKGLVYDIEADGLVADSTLVYCIVGCNLSTSTYKILVNGDIVSDYELKQINKFLDKDGLRAEYITDKNVPDLFLSNERPVICHNQIFYDLLMLKKFYNLDLRTVLGERNIVDTYVMSQALNPDRPMPKGCPTSVKNPVTNKLQKIGPHGLESWGYRVGYKKIQIDDWRYFDVDKVKRCLVDVQINIKTYIELLKEAGMYV